MIVSINPGGPNRGSATQYFVGDFDGTTFKSDTAPSTTTWLDYGPDNYAGITWSNAPDKRKIFLGWMSNWAYAQEVPTSPWRSAMTIPRDLLLTKSDEHFVLKSTVAPEIEQIVTETKSIPEFTVVDSAYLNNEGTIDFSQSIVSGSLAAKDFTTELSNNGGQKLIIGFDRKNNRYFIDRSKSGKIDFSKNF